MVALEAAALVVLGLGYAVSGVVGAPEDRVATVLAGVLAVLAGTALVLVARGFGTGRGWALAPTVVAQVFVAVVAVGLLQGRVVAVALPMLAAAGFVLYTVTARATRDVFRAAA